MKPGGTTNPFLPRFSHWRPSRLASWKQMYMQPRNRWSGNVCDNATFHLLFGSPNDEAHRSRPREKRRLRSVQVNFFYGAAFGKDGTPVPVSGLKRITAFYRAVFLGVTCSATRSHVRLPCDKQATFRGHPGSCVCSAQMYFLTVNSRLPRVETLSNALLWSHAVSNDIYAAVL